MKDNKKMQKNKGFTLIELIVVFAIMAVLTSFVTLLIIRYIERARQEMDVHNATLIRDAINIYPFPSDYQGIDVEYTDPETHESEHYERGWVYVDKDEIRCSDASTCLAMIEAGLVYISPQAEAQIRAHETGRMWFPPGPDGDYIRRTNINEYAFKNSMTVKARRTWNTYQLDAYLGADGSVKLGASASNAQRTNGHAKDVETAKNNVVIRVFFIS